jgi:hypothetical protein
MVATINASVSSAGIVSTADASGIIKIQSNGVTTNALAWGNLNLGASPTIRATFNVSSITRNSAGLYTVAFTTNLSDANYCVCLGSNWYNNASSLSIGIVQSTMSVSSFQYTTYVSTTATESANLMMFSVFGN